MENILYNISQVLGITIIHSLWQGLFIYFMLRLALFIGDGLSAAKKYMLASTSLLAIACWFFYTLVAEIQLYSWLAPIPTNFLAMPAIVELPKGFYNISTQNLRYYYNIEKYLPFITILYFSGLLFNTFRLLFANKKIGAIKQTMSIDIQLQRQVNKFADMLNIDHRVQVGLSKLVDVPCMVGYVKPIILLPFTLSTYLGAEEIEAILLHELAHIKRNDYLMNLLQQIISALLFFNPCAQLINKIIDEERENSCDDLVVQSTPNPVTYALALLKLEETRENNMRMALSATGKKYQLLSRIERIMKTKKTTHSFRPALLAMLILTLGIGSIAVLKPEIAQGTISIKSVNPVFSSLLPDTTHKDTVKKAAPLREQAVKRTHQTSHKAEILYIDSADRDKKIAELNADIDKHAQDLDKYYNNDEFKATQRELEEKAKALQDLYNNDDLKRTQEDLMKLGADFSRNWGDDDKLKDISSKMGKKGAKLGEYFNSAEFKKMNEDLEKKYGIPADRQYFDDDKDENYRKYQAELQSNIPSEIKEMEDQLKVMGEKMGSRYNSPEFKEKSRRMQIFSDTLKIAFESRAFKKQQMEMEKLGQLMSANLNNQALKKEAELLEKSIARLTEYLKSAEYRKYLKSLRKNYNYNFKFDYNDDYEKPEKPGLPEKPAKPEKPEKPGEN